MKEIKLTRQELYDLVWIEPILTLSKKYIISDSDLRKQCIKMGIPLPDSGYWSKIRYGKKVIKLKLSEDYIGDEDVILILREVGDENVMPEKSTLSVLQKEIENDPRVKLKVPDRLNDPDKTIISFMDSFNERKTWKTFDGRVVQNEGIVLNGFNKMDIKVSTKTITRTLRIMNTFIKALKNRGHELIIKYRETYIKICGQEIMIICREKQKRIIVKGEYSDSSKYQPTGILYIKIGNPWDGTTYIDGKKPLEEQLSRIIASLELKGKKLLEDHLKWQKENIEKEERKRIEKELQQRKEKELEDFKDLIEKAKRCDEAQMIRAYIDELEKRAIVKNSLHYELKKQIDWARKKADWYDPFIERDDELLREVDREELNFKKKSNY